MIEYTTGSILNADAELLVNAVNCVGYMGRGIALQFKRAYPGNFEAYQAACKRGDVKPGVMHVFETGALTNPRYIVNFPTKRHWRGKSRLEDIDAGLQALTRELETRGVRSVAVPPLGCGLGGLDWSIVRPRIERALSQLPEVKSLVFEPSEGPVSPAASKTKEVPKMTPGRAVLVGLVERYLGGLMDPFVTLLEVHKLMYFAQEAGQPLQLRYVKGPMGPYAENLRHVLSTIEGHYLTGYADGDDDPEKQLTLVPGAIEDAREHLRAHPDTLRRFERVAELVEGFETPFGTELLATVHWVVSRGEARDADAVIDAVHRWGQRKQAMSPRQIRLALDKLSELGWLDQNAA